MKNISPMLMKRLHWLLMSHALIGVLFIFELAPGGGILHLNWSAETYYIIFSLYSALVGSIYAYVYPGRYYIAYIMGAVVGSIGALYTASIYLSEVHILHRLACVVAFAGAIPGFLLFKLLKLCQDFIVPLSKVEIAEIAKVQQVENEVFGTREERSRLWKDDSMYRCCFYGCISFVVAPIGFLFSYIGYRYFRLRSCAGRRLAILGLWLNSIVLGLYFFAFLYFFVWPRFVDIANVPHPVDPATVQRNLARENKKQVARMNNNVPVIPQAAPVVNFNPPMKVEKKPVLEEHNKQKDAPIVKMENEEKKVLLDKQSVLKTDEIKKPRDPGELYRPLVDDLNGKDLIKQEQALDCLLAIDPDIVPKDILKSVAQRFKQIAFNKTADPYVRIKAIEGMAKWGGSFSVPLIIELLESNDVSINSACFKELKQLKDPRAIAPITKYYLTNPLDKDVEAYLETYGTEAESAVVKYFPQNNPLQFKRALDYLTKNGTEKSLKFLTTLRSKKYYLIYTDDINNTIKTIQEREKDNKSQ
jgi:hypothetical protein